MTAPRMVNTPEPEFARHLQEIAQHWKTIVALTIATFVAVFVARSLVPDTYESSAVLQVKLSETLLDDGSATEFRSLSLAELAVSPEVVADALARAGFRTDQTRPDDIDVGVRDTPGFIELSVSASSGRSAQELTSALAAELVRLGTDLDSGVRTEIIDAPEEPDSPVAPRPLQEAILASVVAALLASEAMVGIRKLRGRVNPIAPDTTLERLTSVPTLDLRFGGKQEHVLLPFFFDLHLLERPVITVMQRGDEATTEPAALLAKTAAGLRRRVLLIDADLAKPILHREFGHQRSPGLAEVLSGRNELREVVRRAGDDNPTAVLSAGSPMTDVSDVDRVVATHQVVNASQADCAVLSTTATSSLDEALLVAHHFGDAVVLAVEIEGMKENEIIELADRVRAVGARLVGIVVYRPKRRERSLLSVGRSLSR